MMKADKRLYIYFQVRNTTNYDYMKEFEAYINVIKYYGRIITIRPGLVKAKLAKIELMGFENLNPEEKEQAE